MHDTTDTTDRPVTRLRGVYCAHCGDSITLWDFCPSRPAGEECEPRQDTPPQSIAALHDGESWSARNCSPASREFFEERLARVQRRAPLE